MRQKLTVLTNWASRAGRTLDADISRSLAALLRARPELANEHHLERVVTALRAWHSRLLWACKGADPPCEGLLVGFSALCDQSLPAEELLAQWMAHCQEAVEWINDPEWKPQDPVRNEQEAIAFLLWSAQNPREEEAGGKATLTDQVFRAFGNIRGWKFQIGGASAHIAHLFGELGLKVCLVNLYHPPQLACMINSNAKRLKGWSQGMPELQSASQGQPGAPVRVSYIVHYRQGQNLANVFTQVFDRVVFRYPRWIGPKEWTQVKLIDADGSESEWAFLRREVNEWPWIPGFLLWEVNRNTLYLKFAPFEVIEALAQHYRYFLLSGIEVAAPLGDGPQPARDAFWRQLRHLVENGVRVHLEFSGLKTTIGLSELKRAFSDILTSAGINDKELIACTNLRDACFARSTFRDRAQGASAIYERYLRARFLAEELKLNRLYVHGNDVDLILCKRGTPGSMRSEIMADLFAKGMVVLALIERADPEQWQRNVKQMPVEFPANAFKTLLELAEDMARDGALTPEEKWNLVERGYWVPPSVDEYAVGVVPVFWPESVLQKVDTTGAGDITSALSLIFSGP